MKAFGITHRLVAALAGLFFVSLQQAQGCSVCMGADFKSGEAINGAIFLMLGFLATMFAGIGAVTYSIYRRRHNLVQEQPAYAAVSVVASR